MGRNTGAVKYAGGMATSRVGLTNMYIYGGGIISLVTLAAGLLSTGSFEGAVNILVEFYAMRLIPWPIDEILAAETMMEVIGMHMITISVGLFFATWNWRANV